MAQVFGRENIWLNQLSARRWRAVQLELVTFVAVTVAAALYHPLAGAAAIAIGTAVILQGLRKWGYATDGAAGEFATAVLLGRLPPEFTVFNDIPMSGFNIDHVVVGPTGVWLIETKSHPGVVEVSAEGVSVNGRRMFRDPRGQARRTACDLGRLLRAGGVSCWVEPLVCFPRAAVRHWGARDLATVVDEQNLLSRLRTGGKPLTRKHHDRIVASLAAMRGGDVTSGQARTG